MNHYVLPYGRREAHDTRYGEEALPRLLEQLCRRGAVRHRLRAKLYGGARTLGCNGDIGEMNIELAHRFMQDNDIPVADVDLGGRSARWIKFHPATEKSVIRTTPGLASGIRSDAGRAVPAA